MSKNKATLIGFIAIFLWSTIVGLIKSVSEGFGPVAGAAMIYTCSSILLLFVVGFPKISKFPRSYLILGSALFVCYEICLSLSIGFSHNGKQAIEVGMVNYLWPAMTIILTLIVNRQKANWLIIPGIAISFIGIIKVLAGDQGFSINEMINNLYSNPLSYGLAFIGAIIWAVYCVVTVKIAKGNNGITLFFILVSIFLWLQYLLTPQPEFQLTIKSWVMLLLSSISMGLGYAAWNIGILRGNITILVSTSYFIPVISAFISSIILNSILTINFWQGAGMVCVGSLISWWSTKIGK